VVDQGKAEQKAVEQKAVYQFEDFLQGIEREYMEFTLIMHESLADDGYKVKIEPKPKGLFVSYAHPKTRRSILNLFMQKDSLMFRIYADNLSNYENLLEGATEKMENEIKKAHECKRLAKTGECNPKCVMGYDFTLRGARYLKCRYSCFQFEVSKENSNILTNLIERERKERLGALRVAL
jgi:hypothetical protein